MEISSRISTISVNWDSYPNVKAVVMKQSIVCATVSPHLNELVCVLISDTVECLDTLK